jgi:hypothetical protein
MENLKKTSSKTVAVLSITLIILSLLITYPFQAAFAQPWYWKAGYADYAPSGMPDFDQRQGGAYLWVDQWGAWSHCGPVAVANSLWWLDSEFEPNPMPPQMINDGFPLVQAYGPQWDDHSPLNVPWLVEHLAFLMDTDGRRTGLIHSGTNVNDMEAGLTHYLSWTGVNPQGDVNGDGIVDNLDVNIVQAAMGSVPGAPGWNLAADIFPASTIYPPATDNIVNMNDLMLVTSNMGNTGIFYEHTVMQPDFYFIENEVERCQDVVLLVGYWIFDTQSGTWYREQGAHFVTVAGVDSADLKLALSDPVQDAFESGSIPEGRIPVPHIHPAPEPPYITHNDAQYVSQDIYSVAQITPMWPPCPGGNWMLVNFASWRPAPPFFAVIESAVVTSPYLIDVAVTDVSTSKTGCLPMPTVGQGLECDVYVTVENQGELSGTFDVYAYADGTEIGHQQITLDAGESGMLTFTWDTTGCWGSYTISASASPVRGELDTSDNRHADGSVNVGLIGDVNPFDGYVGIDDIFNIATHFGHEPPDWDPTHDPNYDLNNDIYIGIDDIFTAAQHFGEENPP